MTPYRDAKSAISGLDLPLPKLNAGNSSLLARLKQMSLQGARTGIAKVAQIVVEKSDYTYELHVGERQMGTYESRYQITFVIMIPGAFFASIATAQSSLDFVETQRISSGHTWNVEVADLDGDGDLDIVFGNAASQANEVWL